jgi:hypothetical protein
MANRRKRQPKSSSGSTNARCFGSIIIRGDGQFAVMIDRKHDSSGSASDSVMDLCRPVQVSPADSPMVNRPAMRLDAALFRFYCCSRSACCAISACALQVLELFESWVFGLQSSISAFSSFLNQLVGRLPALLSRLPRFLSR